MKLEIKVLNSMRLTKLLIAASRWLSKYADVLNDLNVYPVPDGDTGTNMSMTLQAVENELIKLNHEPNMKELVEIVSEAILLGARGNSGTILSQIIQGFLSSIEDKEEITVDDVIKFMNNIEKRGIIIDKNYKDRIINDFSEHYNKIDNMLYNKKEKSK